MFVSCGGGQIDIELEDLAEYITSKVDLFDFIELSPQKKQNDYNINEENAEQSVVMISLDINSSEEIFLIKAIDRKNVKEITNNLKKYKTYTLNGLKNYEINDNERQYYIVDGSKIITKGNYIFWVIHRDAAEINKIIEQYIKDNG
jgi:hypothetical protein